MKPISHTTLHTSESETSALSRFIEPWGHCTKAASMTCKHFPVTLLVQLWHIGFVERLQDHAGTAQNAHSHVAHVLSKCVLWVEVCVPNTKSVKDQTVPLTLPNPGTSVAGMYADSMDRQMAWVMAM